MHLRSGAYLGTRTTDIASVAFTRESGTRSQGKLEGIPEYSSSETQSDTFSMAGSEREHNFESLRKGKLPGNPFNDPSLELDFDTQLAHLYTNAHRAQIYQDPQGRYSYKSAELSLPFEERPWVNAQGGHYIDMNGARYVITKFPQSTDSWGIIQTEYGMPSAPPIEIGAEAGTTTNDATHRQMNHNAGPSRNPTGSGMSTAQTLNNLFADVDSQNESKREGNERGPTLHLKTWKPIRDIVVTKVSQDYGWTEVFKDSDEAYYATLKLLMSNSCSIGP